ncbi:MAG: dihydropteroate synthase [Alphaproteobacteria bacterium]|nr:MAG: dihydropteroate synthase [Alphaproteobacteria bacterium]
MLPAPKIESGPWIMGIVNATPDSFSDGGRYADADAAICAGLRMLEDGADVLDVGGESTRPGAAPVSEAEEIDRVVPVIEGLRRASDATISVDTMKPGVARAAMAAGAAMWNDVNALRAPGAVECAADLGCDVVLMHMQGEPRTMQANPVYADVVAEVIAFLRARADAASDAGVAREKIWIDPGIGFGKTLAHNMALTRAIPQLRYATKARPLFAASRKSFIARIDPASSEARDRIGGSLAIALRAAALGADMLRVHDVRETVQALRVWNAIDRADP